MKIPVIFLTESSVYVCVDHAGGFKHTPSHHQRMTNALRSSEAVINVSIIESRGASVCRKGRLADNRVNYTLSTHSCCQRDTALGSWLITGMLFDCVSGVLTEQASWPCVRLLCVRVYDQILSMAYAFWINVFKAPDFFRGRYFNPNYICSCTKTIVF